MNDNSGSVKPSETPGEANAEAGIVVLDGPDGVAVSMTPKAALQTGESLQRAAHTAQEQVSENSSGLPAEDLPADWPEQGDRSSPRKGSL